MSSWHGCNIKQSIYFNLIILYSQLSIKSTYNNITIQQFLDPSPRIHLITAWCILAAVSWEGIFLVGNYPGGGFSGWELSCIGIFRVGVILGGYFPGGNCPGGYFPRWEFSGWELSGGNFPGRSFHVTGILSALINLYSPWSHQETTGYLIISILIEVNQLT